MPRERRFASTSSRNSSGRCAGDHRPRASRRAPTFDTIARSSAYGCSASRMSAFDTPGRRTGPCRCGSPPPRPRAAAPRRPCRGPSAAPALSHPAAASHRTRRGGRGSRPGRMCPDPPSGRSCDDATPRPVVGSASCSIARLTVALGPRERSRSGAQPRCVPTMPPSTPAAQPARALRPAAPPGRSKPRWTRCSHCCACAQLPERRATRLARSVPAVNEEPDLHDALPQTPGTPSCSDHRSADAHSPASALPSLRSTCSGAAQR